MFAQPACDREIYKLIRKHKFLSMLEIGLESGERCQNMIRVAQKHGPGKVKYTGLDLFDARPEDQCDLRLIQAHRTLKALDAKTQLVPGETHHAISRVANSLAQTDLIVISHGFEDSALEASWFYFPRMLNSRSLVLVQRSENGPFEVLGQQQIEKLAEKSGENAAAAQTAAA